MRVCVLATVGLLVLGLAQADAQSYRGKWEAAGGKNGRCPAFLAHITVAGDNINIGVGGARTYRLKGKVAQDGSFKAEGTNGETRAEGKFTVEAVELVLHASCGTRTATGHRAH